MPSPEKAFFKFIIKSVVSRTEKKKTNEITNVQLNYTVGEVQSTILLPKEDVLITSISFFKKLPGRLASATGDMHVRRYIMFANICN